MALSLTYDQQLSRVRVAASWPALVDTFTRTVANGWGTTDTGQAWTLSGGVAADYSVNGSAGLMSVSDTNVERRMLLDWGGTDQQIRTWCTLPVTPAGAAINWGVVLRWQDANNYYWVDVQVPVGGGLLTLRLVKRVAGVVTQVTTITTTVASSTTVPRVLKAQIIGSSIKARLWASDGSEPTTWQMEQTDPDLAAGTQVGVISRRMFGNTNTSPVVFSFDNVRAEQPSPVVVQRSTDQVRWTTVRGGAAAPVTSDAVALDDYEFAPDVANWYRVAGQMASITPTLDAVWIKSVARPFLNRKVKVRDFSEISRSSRTGLFNVVGRSFPVAVTDVRGSRRWTLLFKVADANEAKLIDLLAASGDILLIQAPTTGRVAATPTGYVALGDTSEVVLPTFNLSERTVSWQCTEVAAPGPDVVGATSNWQTVLTTYATWADLLAANAAWEDLLELVGAPTDVIVS